jgi:1-acyl-sn-glycerol-3-phosphate acyltransferase
LLDNKSLSVALGGRSEANYIEPNKMTIIANNRRGVFKLALETGAPIIPVLSYGENKAYRKMDNILIDALSYLFKFKIPIPTLTSLKDWFKIYKNPLENKIETFIGDPIEVGPAHVPTDKEIIELREKYIEALKDLYNKTKPDDYEETLEIL